MSETSVVRSKSLEERINERLHESIGDLITPEDLRAIVERGVEGALFAPSKVARSYGGFDEGPSLVERLVEKHLSDEMRAAVSKWIAENPEQMRAAVDGAIERGVGNALMRALDDRFFGIFDAGVENMQSRGMMPRTPTF